MYWKKYIEKNNNKKGWKWSPLHFPIFFSGSYTRRREEQTLWPSSAPLFGSPPLHFETCRPPPSPGPPGTARPAPASVKAFSKRRQDLSREHEEIQAVLTTLASDQAATTLRSQLELTLKCTAQWAQRRGSARRGQPNQMAALA